MQDEFKRLANDAHILKTEQALRHWDSRRARDKHELTNPPHNRGQVIFRLDALFQALNDLERAGLDIASASVLDVGAADGEGLRHFLLTGFRLDQLHGIDLFEDRISLGLRATRGLDLQWGDGAAMPYENASFDLVCEQFCFCHIPDDTGIKARIAGEILRTVKPGGFILINDWRIGSEPRKLYGMGVNRIQQLFPGTKVVGRYRGQLFPVIGRPVSRYVPAIYGLLRLVPFFTGSWVTVLRKVEAPL